VAERNRLLKDGQSEDVWFQALESQMAETGVAIAADRVQFIARLQQVIANQSYETFPAANLSLVGFCEEKLLNHSALEVEQRFKSELHQRREQDREMGATSVGPHRCDLRVFDRARQMPAAQCSTGEQKALLIGLILAHSTLMRIEKDFAPVLLLDEVAAHLDEGRRQALFQILHDLQAQVYLTGTEASVFAPVLAYSNSQILALEKPYLKAQKTA
jgi:DNA replication and repair protein RecF